MTARLLLCSLFALTVLACGGPGGVPMPAGSGRSGTQPNPVGSVGTNGTGGSAADIDSCAVLTDAEIEAATGEKVTERSISALRPDVFPSICDIELDGGGSLTISVRSSGGRSMYETSFEPFIGQGEVLDEALEGLGDKAGISGDDDIMVLKDDVLFDVFFIEFGRENKEPIVRYLAERILAKLPCIATGCPDMPLPPPPTGGPTNPDPTIAQLDPGSLPSTGAQARVVNLYTENGQPVELDVYAYAWSATEMLEMPALVATVPYGHASDWFNPGLIETPSTKDSRPGSRFFGGVIRQIRSAASASSWAREPSRRSPSGRKRSLKGSPGR
jgi:hypothetical protein